MPLFRHFSCPNLFSFPPISSWLSCSEEISLLLPVLMMDKNIFCCAMQIAGKLNIDADHPSRKPFLSHEYSLSSVAFSSLLQLVHILPSIDLFASNSNAKLDMYCSWSYDPLASKLMPFYFLGRMYTICFVQLTLFLSVRRNYYWQCQICSPDNPFLFPLFCRTSVITLCSFYITIWKAVTKLVIPFH